MPEILLSLLLAVSPLAAAQAPTALAPLSTRLQNERDNADLQKVAPFKVFDNLYYVGVGWVASWLLTTSDGLIVIDTLEPRYATHLVDGIVKLGFDPRRIKHVIVLQAHFDHLGGAALLQEKYGAKVWMGARDWDTLAQQATGRGAAEPMPKRDGVIRDGDTLTLGSVSLKLFDTPGHTPGTTSIDLTVTDGGRPYKAFFFGGSAPAPGKAAAEQFLATVRRIEDTQQGVQVRLVNHGFSDAQFWQRVDKLARRKPGDPHPFIEPAGFVPWLQQLKAEAEKQLQTSGVR